MAPVTLKGGPRRRVALTSGALALAATLALAPATQAAAMPDSFADLAEKVSPAVVTITVSQNREMVSGEMPKGMPEAPGGEEGPFKEFFERYFDRENMPQDSRPGPRGPMQGMGSGFILDAEGYVVTNNHVVVDADEIVVTMKDGDEYQAELIGRDAKTDLALLKIESDEALPFVSFGDSDDVRVGDWVMAVGNPFGFGGTVTAGIVSARGRDLSGGTLIDFMQIDAAINRGNSGGPAFNDEGEVIGVNSAIFSPNGGNVGIGFAIPSSTAEVIIADLRDDGMVERGWLGVRIQPVTDDVAEGFGLKDDDGALVASVQDGSPAAKAGLKSGDVILSWDDKAVEKFRDLPRLVAETPIGKSVPVEIWRDKAERTVTVETGKLEAEDKMAAATPEKRSPAGTVEIPDTGLALADLTPEIREQFAMEEELAGVIIVDVAPGSRAEAEGLRPGDVIESVALETVDSAEQALAKVEALREEGERIAMLRVSRQGSASFFALQIGEA